MKILQGVDRLFTMQDRADTSLLMKMIAKNPVRCIVNRNSILLER